MNNALLLVDLQNDFCFNGALAVPEGDEVIKVANQAIHNFRRRNQPIIASLDWHPANHKSFAVNSGTQVGETGILNGLPQVWWPVHCVEKTQGAMLHQQLEKEYINKLFVKGCNCDVDSYSAFFDNGKQNSTGLNEWLSGQKIERLTILGLATDYCVKYTVLDGLRLGYAIDVVIDGCRGVNLRPDDSNNALLEMQAEGARLLKLDEI